MASHSWERAILLPTARCKQGVIQIPKISGFNFRQGAIHSLMYFMDRKELSKMSMRTENQNF